MCGIAGILTRTSRPVEEWGVLGAMSASIAHRGPDGHGYFVSGVVGLAHRRLSIIDVSGGRQPMIDAKRGRVLVYNGELYNFLSLREELEADGQRFCTRSDTEVLLRMAQSDNWDWANRLNGMFAFALWDESTRQLVLGRDRLGIKPLYYAVFEDEFVFASEIKSLLHHPKVRRDVQVDVIPEYLAFRSIAGVETMFKGIRQVPPGHLLVISQADLSLQFVSIWPNVLPPLEHPDGEAAILDRIQHVLEDSVRRQLISDVPVGAYLSGGVDSSLITSLAKPFRGGGEFHTFSVGFNEKEFDESAYARRVATQVGTTHHALVVTEQDYLDQLEQTVRQLDEPLNHAHTIQLQLLSKYAKSYVTVVLTGEGADELFGGYPRLQIPLLARRLRWVPAVLSSGLRVLAGAIGLRRVVKLLETANDEDEAVIQSARYVPMDDMSGLRPDAGSYPRRRRVYEDLPSDCPSDLERLLLFDQQTYLPSLLSRLDKTSMAASVECRVPFLDNEVIDCSRTIPSSLKIRVGRENKVALKLLAARMLPSDLVYRRKVGFGTPLVQWFKNQKGLGRYLELLLDRTARDRGYVDQTRVAALVKAHREGHADHSEILWSLLALELWCRLVVEEPRKDAGATSRSAWNEELTTFQRVPLGTAMVPVSHSGLTV
jgi:asparagine synthase (glutamine-hydrolysing)